MKPAQRPSDAKSPNRAGLKPNGLLSNFSEPVRVIRPDLVLVDYGPMTLTVSAWADGEPRPVMASRAAVFALGLLGELAAVRSWLTAPVGKMINLTGCPPLVRKAVRSCRAVSRELTGLSSVAGLAADAVLQEAIRLGADRVIVNNGGDLALLPSPGQPVRVGLKILPGGEVTHYLDIGTGDHIGGVATSGWTGRSHSPGVADVVTVWAGDCTTADAAATWIAGRTEVNSQKVSRYPAGDLDPATDIPLLNVTLAVGRLNAKEKQAALENGIAEAGRLVTQEIIRGAFIAVQGASRWIGVRGGSEPQTL